MSSLRPQSVPEVAPVPVVQAEAEKAKDTAPPDSGAVGEFSDALEPPRYVGHGTDKSPYIVDWDVGDSTNPYNWSNAKKWRITLQVFYRAVEYRSF